MTYRSVFVALVIAAGLGASCSRNSHKNARRFVEKGDAYFAAKNYPEAIIEYRNAVAQDAGAGEVRLKLADAYQEVGDRDNAVRESVRAADLMPDNVVAQLRAGRRLLEKGQYTDAKERALKGLAKEPKNVGGLILLGYSLAGLRDLDSAIAKVEEAIDADPQQILSYRNLSQFELAKGGRPAAEAALKRAIAVQPNSADAHLSLADFYWSGSQLVDAEREFKTALQLDPKSATGNHALAAFYLNNGRVQESEQYLKAYADIAPTAEPKIILVDYYLLTRREQEATTLLQSIVAIPDGFVPAKLRLAAMAFAAGHRPQAYQTLDEIFKREPKNEAALIERTRFQLAQAKPAEALASANLAVAANPVSVMGHYVRGLALNATGAPDEAIKAFQQVLQLKPSAVAGQIELAKLYLTRGDATTAANFLEQAVKNRPQSTEARLLLAQALLRLGDFARTESELSIVAETHPDSADVDELFGDVYFAKHDFAKAREAYGRALQRRPDRTSPLAGLVRIDLAEAKPTAARSRLESQLAAHPQDAQLMLLAGRTYLAVRDRDRAEAMFRGAITADPSGIEAYGALGALLKTGGRLDEARTEYEEMSRRQPQVAAMATTMIGIILDLQDKPDEARKRYEQALAVDSRFAVAANNLAWNYAERGGNLDVALSLAQTAKGRLPNSWEVGDTLGWIYYKKGLHSLAITTLRDSLDKNPSNAITAYHLGLAYWKNGRPRDAEQALQRALKIDPKFTAADDAKRVLATLKG